MSHIPVMLEQSLEYLNVKENGIYVDCTLGFAGHSSEILNRLSEKGHLYAFDQDTLTLPVAKRKLSAISDNYTVFETNFVNLKDALSGEGVNEVDGIFYDLGVSSHHFDEATRGFTYKVDDAPLDMRMDTRVDLTAAVILNTYSKKEIRDICLMRCFPRRFAASLCCRHIVLVRAIQVMRNSVGRAGPTGNNKRPPDTDRASLCMTSLRGDTRLRVHFLCKNGPT